jgi:hypothetical protein
MVNFNNGHEYLIKVRIIIVLSLNFEFLASHSRREPNVKVDDATSHQILFEKSNPKVALREKGNKGEAHENPTSNTVQRYSLPNLAVGWNSFFLL